MSYEGFEQYICPNKHQWEMDVRSNDSCVCPLCQEEPILYHSVNTTNGVCETDPTTMRAELVEVGFDDEWHNDHYGNRYAVKISKYAPANPDIWLVY